VVIIYSKNHTVFCPYRIIQAPECVLPDSKVAFRCCREILCSQFRYFGCFKHQNVLFIEMAWTCSGLYLKLFQWYTDEAFMFSANAAQTVSNTSSIIYVQSDILENALAKQRSTTDCCYFINFLQTFIASGWYIFSQVQKKKTNKLNFSSVFQLLWTSCMFRTTTSLGCFQ
jgi:hypothetical protein